MPIFDMTFMRPLPTPLEEVLDVFVAGLGIACELLQGLEREVGCTASAP